MSNALVTFFARLRAALKGDRAGTTTSVEAERPAAPARAGVDGSADTADAAVIPTKLILGLGNPGPEYRATRHNIGFRIVERLAARAEARSVFDEGLRSEVAIVRLAGEVVALLAPQTFMNASGEALGAALDRWPSLDPSSDVLVVFDDLDLPVGRIRLRPRGGAGGHKGLRDIHAQLEARAEAHESAAAAQAGDPARPDIARLRFGIGHPGKQGTVIDWVLGPFDPADEAETLPAAIDQAADAVEAFVEAGVTTAMQRFNSAQSA